MVYRSFSYGHLQNRISSLKLKPLTAFSCILNYLFRPKPPALAFISDYSSVFALPSVFSVGIQIRTGDASMKDPEYDTTNALDVHSAFFKCADQLAEMYSMPDQKVRHFNPRRVNRLSCARQVLYYLVTDSAHLREEAIRKLGNKVVVTGAGESVEPCKSAKWNFRPIILRNRAHTPAIWARRWRLQCCFGRGTH